MGTNYTLVLFPDGDVKFGIYNRTVDSFYSELYDTQECLYNSHENDENLSDNDMIYDVVFIFNSYGLPNDTIYIAKSTKKNFGIDMPKYHDIDIPKTIDDQSIVPFLQHAIIKTNSQNMFNIEKKDTSKNDKTNEALKNRIHEFLRMVDTDSYAYTLLLRLHRLSNGKPEVDQENEKTWLLEDRNEIDPINHAISEKWNIYNFCLAVRERRKRWNEQNDVDMWQMQDIDGPIEIPKYNSPHYNIRSSQSQYYMDIMTSNPIRNEVILK